MAALGSRKHNSCFRFKGSKTACPVEVNFCSVNFTDKIKQCKALVKQNITLGRFASSIYSQGPSINSSS